MLMDDMGESTTTTQTEPSPLTGPSSFASGLDAEGLPTVHEVPHRKIGYDFHDPTVHHSAPLQRPSGSRDASMTSSMNPSYDEKGDVAEPPPVPFITSPSRESPHLRHTYGNASTKLRKDDRRRTMATGYAEPEAGQRPKRGGLRNTLRRIFGRRSVRDRISMPAGPVYHHHHDPEEFITSATDMNDVAPHKERSASVPTNHFLRSSGLSSHPPLQSHQSHQSPPVSRGRDLPMTLDPPVTFAPERPPRPRRASVPSIIFSKDDMQAVTDAMSGIGLQTSQDQQIDTRNIGFAVTNGSNPKRRSRSVGACQENDHRMSPIQWRQHRTRSDEIKYLRQSLDVSSKVMDLGPSESDQPDAPSDSAGLEPPNGEFNFGLQTDSMQGQERIGLEERLITLEIKLMDFEYALSRIQAGSGGPSRRHSSSDMNGLRLDGSHHSSEAPPTPRDGSSILAQIIASQRRPATDSVALSRDRPTSVATTLKPSHRKNNSSSKFGLDLAPGIGPCGLTIEHYEMLVNSVHRERSARLALEDQVSRLQKQMESIHGPYQPHSHQRSVSSNNNSFANHSHTQSNSSHQSRVLGMVPSDGRRGGRYYAEPRPRSSSYSTNETDTTEDYHDAYLTPANITPVERGEYERNAFERMPGVKDGEAF